MWFQEDRREVSPKDGVRGNTESEREEGEQGEIQGGWGGHECDDEKSRE